MRHITVAEPTVRSASNGIASTLAGLFAVLAFGVATARPAQGASVRESMGETSSSLASVVQREDSADIVVAPTADEIRQDRLDRKTRIERAEDRFKAKVFSLFEPPIGPRAWAIAMALCLVWGAAHAFAPGHGKVLVSSYLVGAKGSYAHAALLGMMVTFTHTFLVLVFAVAAFLMQDRFVYPIWLQPVGAIVILVVGVNQIRLGLVRMLHADGHRHDHDHGHGGVSGDHDHDHEHVHDASANGHVHSHGFLFKHRHAPAKVGDGTARTRDILMLGVTGGIVPCPSAIVMLLLAWQLEAPSLGLACLLSFSVGLALTLTSVGFLAVSGTRLVLKWLSRERSGHVHRLRIESVMPLIGGMVLIVFGLVLLTRY